MKLAKSILCGMAAFGMAAGTAVAMDAHTSGASNSEPSYVLMDEPMLVYEETYVIADPSFDGQVAWNDSPSADMTAYYVYDVDDDMDGRPDGQLIIEQSDTLASSPSDAALDESGGS